jgi:hypothetical protein
MLLRPLKKFINGLLHPTGRSSVKDLSQCGVINELECETGRLQVVNQNDEGLRAEVQSLRHSSVYQLQLGKDVLDLNPLPSISQERSQASEDDIW